MRLRPTGTAALLSALLAATIVAPAAADETSERKAQVDRSIEHLEHDLQETSTELATALARVEETRAQLTRAQEKVDGARAELAEAQERDAQIAKDLERARQEEAAARRQLAAVVARMEESKAALGAVARRAYLKGGAPGLDEMAVVLEAQSADDLASGAVYARSAMRTESNVVDALDRDRAAVAATTRRLQAKREEVAALKVEAEAQLERTRRLEADAAAAAARVQALLAQAEQAAATLEAEKRAESGRLEGMRAESAKLAAELAERARLARERAAAQSAAGIEGLRWERASRDGRSVLALPVVGRVSSEWGMRKHPVTGVVKLHDGVDFAAPCGTPLAAAAAGEVIWAANRGGYGYQVAIDHGIINGVHVATSYSHLPAGGFVVSPGQQVHRGQVVGHVGSTGYSTGCHLHLMVYVDGLPTDPSAWF